MTDVTAGENARPAAAGGSGLSSAIEMMKRGDIALAIGVLLILTILIVPLPPSCWTFSWRPRSSCRC